MDIALFANKKCLEGSKLGKNRLVLKLIKVALEFLFSIAPCDNAKQYGIFVCNNKQITNLFTEDVSFQTLRDRNL